MYKVIGLVFVTAFIAGVWAGASALIEAGTVAQVHGIGRVDRQISE